MSDEELHALHEIFTADDRLESHISGLHEEAGAIDLKRGEFYTQILRANHCLRETVAATLGLDTAQVHPNFGGNGAIDTFLTAARVMEEMRHATWRAAVAQAGAPGVADSEGQPPSGVLLQSPTYFRYYNVVAARRFRLITAPSAPNYAFDTRAFIDAIRTERPAVVILVSPNNPTGIAIPDRDLLAVLDAVPDGVWVFLDRTLVNTDTEISTRALLARYAAKELAVLHSFSKYKCMSHLRIGLTLYSNPLLARQIEPLLPLGLMLEACIRATRWVRLDGGIVPSPDIQANIRANKGILSSFVHTSPAYSVTDFSGNYCLLGLPEGKSSRETASHLASHGVFVMGGHELPEKLPNVLRLHTAGPPEHMWLLCDALRKWDKQ